MPRPTGLSKTGGRVAGVENRKTTALKEKCSALGFDPFNALIEIAQSDEDPALRFSALKELCSYLYPKRKAIEVSNEGDNEIRVTLRDYTSPVKT